MTDFSTAFGCYFSALLHTYLPFYNTHEGFLRAWPKITKKVVINSLRLKQPHESEIAQKLRFWEKFQSPIIYGFGHKTLVRTHSNSSSDSSDESLADRARARIFSHYYYCPILLTVLPVCFTEELTFV